MQALSWILLGFFCGSLPFSLWLGKLFLHADIRKYGDGNPGATNALRAGGWTIGLAAYFLDFFKGALPVALAYQVFDLRSLGMFLAALAPPLGHAFSPFLGWKGGKALAVTLGTWIGLTLYEVPVVILVQLVFWFLVLTVDGWSVMATILGTAAYLFAFKPDPLLLSILAGDAVLVIWKHRRELRQPPGLKPWVRRLWTKPPPPGK
jgi:glycerol-3-phosphate acyltransferase PlsY